MNSAAQDAPHRPEFDKFLFTLIGDDQHGLPLSVVSFLARMNLDPWQEAGTLADLPAEAVAGRLAGSLDTLTDPVLRQAISETLILRLLAQLPRRTAGAVKIPVAGGEVVAANDPGTRIQTIIFIASTLVLIVAAQILAAHRSAPMRPGVVPGPAVLTVPAQTLPAASSH